LDIVSKAEGRMLDVAQCVAGAPHGAAVYCCGPESLLGAVEAAVEASTAPRHTLHLERFGRPNLALDSTEATETASVPSTGEGEDVTECDPNGAFQVILQRTGVTVQVPPDRSILEVVRETRRDLTFSCGSGYCGTCETRVIQGVPDHRDEVLDSTERAANKSMMICVSRSCQTKLVLDL
jgi:ferredoxin